MGIIKVLCPRSLPDAVRHVFAVVNKIPCSVSLDNTVVDCVSPQTCAVLQVQHYAAGMMASAKYQFVGFEPRLLTAADSLAQSDGNPSLSLGTTPVVRLQDSNMVSSSAAH
jgi:hypothetical protein